uniref:Uncharacterized protein n=1 Tax=Tetradesmus obliquus TaxID=3088 RepID=A0A383V1T4_TETOB|eukprot:jgi/Sobl393_1/7750/SZX59518.1
MPGLNTAEINAIIARLQQADPEAFVGKDITELSRELASASLNAIVDDSNATISLQVVTTELLESLDATQGPPGQPAPTPPDADANVTVFSPPEDCPGWECVCAGKPAQAKAVAPDHCQAFITCDGKGTGVKVMCPIAGTGFSPASGTCKALDGPPLAGEKCNFADDSIGPASSARQSSGPASYDCASILSSAATSNIVAKSEAGTKGCTPKDPRKPARVEVRASNASIMITTALVKYLEAGPTTALTIASARGAANITSFRAHRRVVTFGGFNDTASVQSSSVWQPRTAVVHFTRPAGAVVLSLAALKPGAGILLLSVDVTEALLPPPELQLSSLTAAPVARPAAGNLTGVKVPITAITNASEPGVAAQSFGAIRNSLKTITNTKWWQRIEKVNDIAGNINNAVGQVIDAAQMRGYAQTYQGVLLGASQCYKHSYSCGAGHIPSSKYQCYLRYKLLLRA